MTKKRLTVIVLFSPLILVILFLMVFATCVGYAVNGKWELKELVHQWKEA